MKQGKKYSNFGTKEKSLELAQDIKSCHALIDQNAVLIWLLQYPL